MNKTQTGWNLGFQNSNPAVFSQITNYNQNAMDIFRMDIKERRNNQQFLLSKFCLSSKNVNELKFLHEDRYLNRFYAENSYDMQSDHMVRHKQQV